MNEVKWIKIITNIFDDEKIQLIESMPDSDTVIVIWFKLLALAGRINNGGIVMMNEKTPYTDEMLATIFRRKLTVIKLALRTFENFGMIEILDNRTILVNNWGKHQNLDQLELMREKTRLRVARHRKNQKLLLETKKIEKEDKEEDIDIESNISVTLHKIIDLLNDKAEKGFRYKTTKTKSLIKAKLNEGFTLEDFERVIYIKTAEWINTDMDKFLRPETLFGNKFEGYLQQKDIKTATGKHLLPKDIEADWLDDYIKKL